MTDIPTWWMKGDWFDLCSCKIPARAGLPKRKAIENEVDAFGLRWSWPVQQAHPLGLDRPRLRLIRDDGAQAARGGAAGSSLPRKGGVSKLTSGRSAPRGA